MTRKRFVKCLMALGCSRNTAAQIAALPSLAGSPYLERYEDVVCFVASQAAEDNNIPDLVLFLKKLTHIGRTPYYGFSLMDFFGGGKNEQV